MRVICKITFRCYINSLLSAAKKGHVYRKTGRKPLAVRFQIYSYSNCRILYRFSGNNHWTPDIIDYLIFSVINQRLFFFLNKYLIKFVASLDCAIIFYTVRCPSILFFYFLFRISWFSITQLRHVNVSFNTSRILYFVVLYTLVFHTWLSLGLVCACAVRSSSSTFFNSEFILRLTIER